MEKNTNASASSANPSLAGKSIFVTGGASGLGAALCRVLSEAGARVMLGDLNQERAQAVAESLRKEGDMGDKGGSGSGIARIQATQCDVGDPDSAQRAIESTIETFGRLDVLINNAGTDKTCPLEELSFADWDRVMRTNLYGPFLLTKYAAQRMKQQGSGHIVNVASTAAKRAWPNASAYHASKWGLLGFSHAMHAELRPHNIKVTAIIAGGMRTPFLLDRFPDIDASTLQDPLSAARAIQSVLLLPEETVIPEVTILPMRETSWP